MPKIALKRSQLREKILKQFIKTTAKILAAGAFLGIPSVSFASPSLSGELVIVTGMSNPAPRAVIEDMVDRFGKMHPDLDIKLTINVRDTMIEGLRSITPDNAPDIVEWYAANRMVPFVKNGLFEDISDVWAEDEFVKNLASTKGALTVDGKQYGVPYTYYQWGIYYRQDIFKELGLSEPTNWAEEKANCAKIVASGRACYTIGTKWLWTAAGWFDYINMRTNGFDFHMDLAAGKASWTDDRVRQAFANWRELIDMGAFIKDHQTYSWQEALPFIVNGEAASLLIGNFAVSPLREAGLDDSKLDFYQFVPINSNVALAEDAPTDTLHITKYAKNKENAKEFLRFVVSAENQTIINSGKGLGQLPVNAAASIDDDKFLNEGFAMLSSNSPGGVAQFFDRDYPAEMNSVAMEGIQEFMVFPDNLNDILERLEAHRKDVY